MNWWRLVALVLLVAGCRSTGDETGDVADDRRAGDVGSDSNGPDASGQDQADLDGRVNPDGDRPDTDSPEILDAGETETVPDTDGVDHDQGLDSGDDTADDITPAPSLHDLAVALAAGDMDIAGPWVDGGKYQGPLCDDDICIIISSVPTEGEVFIRGDFNGWAEGDIMKPVPGKATYFYYVLEGWSFAGHFGYKLYYDADWHLDLSNIYIEFTDVSINSAAYKNGVSRLAMLGAVYASALNNYRDVYLYLPKPMFDNVEMKYPVLYMQDGFNVFKNSMAPFGSWDVDVSLDKLIADGEVEPLIVVGISTNDRWDEYLYGKVYIDLGNEPFFSDPKLPLYLEFVVNDLKPLVDSRFPTLAGAENTGIAGSSLGGISSLYMGWSRPDVFGKVGCFSGSFWVGEALDPGEDVAAFRTIVESTVLTPEHGQLKVYMDAGDQGKAVAYMSDARVYTDWTRNALIKKGFPNRPEWDDDGDVFTPPQDYAVSADPEDVPTLYWSESLPPPYDNWFTYLRPDLRLLAVVGEGHAHNEAAWRARFPNAMRYLFGSP